MIQLELDDLIKSIDIVDFISNYVDLVQRGDEWWGLSCFKDEKTPSFSVRQKPPVFFDYSSGIGGNVYTFVRHYHNCSAPEAVEILKKYAGLNDVDIKVRYKLNATTVFKRFEKPKTTVKQSKATVLADDYMNRYENRDDMLNIWRSEGISDESLEKFQVKYDSFSERIVYPIKNVDGKIVNIGGRTVDSDWKAKKLRKYCYFYQWGTMNTIYGLSDNLEYIKEKKEIIIFEGCKSVLLADSWGIRNTGAILTSHLNANQLKILAKLGCRVVFALDKDIDVTQDHQINKLKQFVTVEYIKDKRNLLNEKDSPVDKGVEVFQKLYEQRCRLN